MRVRSDEDQLPEVLRVSDVASYLRLHPKTIYMYIREGKLRAVRCGRYYRVRREWLADFLDADGIRCD